MPVLVVTDPEIIKEVMIKQFDVFPNRRTRASIGLKYMRKIISVMQHEEWRRTRNALTPTFTGETDYQKFRRQTFCRRKFRHR